VLDRRCTCYFVFGRQYTRMLATWVDPNQNGDANDVLTRDFLGPPNTFAHRNWDFNYNPNFTELEGNLKVFWTEWMQPLDCNHKWAYLLVSYLNKDRRYSLLRSWLSNTYSNTKSWATFCCHWTLYFLRFNESGNF
jgi:hypothetical protein